MRRPQTLAAASKSREQPLEALLPPSMARERLFVAITYKDDILWRLNFSQAAADHIQRPDLLYTALFRFQDDILNFKKADFSGSQAFFRTRAREVFLSRHQYAGNCLALKPEYYPERRKPDDIFFPLKREIDTQRDFWPSEVAYGSNYTFKVPVQNYSWAHFFSEYENGTQRLGQEIQAGAHDLDKIAGWLGRTPLQNAVASNAVDKARLILSAGANVNAPGYSYSEDDEGEFSALHLARSSEMAALLLHAGANPHAIDNFGHVPFFTVSAEAKEPVFAAWTRAYKNDPAKLYNLCVEILAQEKPGPATNFLKEKLKSFFRLQPEFTEAATTAYGKTNDFPAPVETPEYPTPAF